MLKGWKEFLLREGDEKKVFCMSSGGLKSVEISNESFSVI
jgi:hypothetical protein